jgi:transcriptional regulator with XRE-family HTH domain
MPEFFAERLKELRAKAGLSQAALADRSGVAVSTIRQFEYGLREPTYGTLVKLARGLGVSLAAFNQQEERPKPPASRPGESREAKKPRGKRKEK